VSAFYPFLATVKEVVYQMGAPGSRLVVGSNENSGPTVRSGFPSVRTEVGERKRKLKNP